MRGMRGTREMFTRIPGNLLVDSGECYYFNILGMFKKIPWNVRKDSREYSRGFRGMFKKIPGKVPEDSGECLKKSRGMFEKIPGNAQEDSGEGLKRFRGMFEKIPGNVQEDSGESKFRFILRNLAYFHQILQLNCDKTKEYFLRYYLLLITNLLRLNTVFLPPFSFLISFSCRGKGVITVRRCRGVKKL